MNYIKNNLITLLALLTLAGVAYGAETLLHIRGGGTNNNSFSNNSVLFYNGSAIVSTSTQPLYIGSLNATSTTATSTFSGGINIAGGGLKISTLISCDSLDTDASGVVICGTDATGAGGAFAWTPTTNYGKLVNATTTPIWFQNGLMASTTSYLVNASTTQVTVSDKLYASFSHSALLSATSTLGTGTTTLKFSGFSQASSVTEWGCVGTGAGTFRAWFGDGTASSTMVISATGNTTTFTTISANNAFIRGEAFYISFGSVSGAVAQPSCSYTRVTQ